MNDNTTSEKESQELQILDEPEGNMKKKGENKSKEKKNFKYIFLLVGLFFVILLYILISSKKSPPTDIKDPKKDIPKPPKPIIRNDTNQSIFLTLDITEEDLNIPIHILGYKEKPAFRYKLLDNAELYLDNKRIPNTPTLNFTKIGKYNIEYRFNFLLLTALGLFYNSSYVEEIDVSHLITDHIKVFQRMFSHCTKLRKINFGNFNTGNATCLREMFENCENLEEIDVSMFNTSKCWDFESMFAGCIRLKELDLDSFTSEEIRTANYMFEGCDDLRGINLTNFKLVGSTPCKHFVHRCFSLEYVNIKYYDLMKLNFGKALTHCKMLMRFGTHEFRGGALSNDREPIPVK